MKKPALHFQILIAIGLGVGFGYLVAAVGWSDSEGLRYVKLVGDLFMRLLKMIAVPLVLFSLVAGIASLSDTRRLARMGAKTLGLYFATTVVAIVIGLGVVNVIRPGSELGPETRNELRSLVVSGDRLSEAKARVTSAGDVHITDQILLMVPDNPFAALTNASMLQVVFFALLLGLALARLPREKSAGLVDVVQTASDAVLEMVMMIMAFAPYGVFALIASLVSSLGRDAALLSELGWAVGKYMLAVVVGLALHVGLVYAPLVRFLGRTPLVRFFKAILPAQLLALSSSSSGATLPVTIACVEQGLDVDEEATSFILPIGATLNMDGTALYQGVAAVFIATMYNMDLDLADQLSIVLMASLASIGTAAVPGVGIVMLVMVLQQIEVPAEGIALILAVDRPLDMCRTAINVTGDASVCLGVARSEGMITPGRTPAAESAIPVETPEP